MGRTGDATPIATKWMLSPNIRRLAAAKQTRILRASTESACRLGGKEQSWARDEALALAETRGEVIVDLRRRLAALERRLRKTTVDSVNRVRELETLLQNAETEAREDAYRMQRFYAAALSDLLRDVQSDLENEPPDLERTLARIHELIDGERPAA